VKIKTVLSVLDRSKEYRLQCGHNNGVVPNVWPCDIVICTECGSRSTRLEEVKKASK